MTTKPAPKHSKPNEPKPFDLEDYVRRSADASHVPLHVKDVGVLGDVAAMVKPSEVKLPKAPARLTTS